MRKIIYHLLLISVIINLSCRKSEIEKLPSATQVGAGTFGCLVNGKAFKPKGNPFGGPVKSASYQYLNSSNSTGYFFSVSAKNSSGGSVIGVAINTDSLPIQQGQVIPLENYGKKGAAAAQYTHFRYGSTPQDNMTMDDYMTTNIYKGELHITKFDVTNRIVSGTFWFDAINKNGEKLEVREGRFDMLFSL